MRFKIIFNFFSVYFIWGSTYLAIYYAIQSISPFVAGGFRFLIAALLIFIWQGFRKLSFPSLKIALISGALLGGLGNGLVLWAEQKVASGTAALWIATVPIWILVLNSIFLTKVRPSFFAILGAVLGFVGILILTWSSGTNSTTSWPHIIALWIAALAWSIGTLYSKKVHPRENIYVFSAYQMLGSSLMQFFLALVSGGFAEIHLQNITRTSLLALLYLATFGSFLAYTSYVWLIRHVDAQKVSTYALVNPLVAIFLGSLFVGERFTLSTVFSCIFVLVGVSFILFGPKKTPLEKSKTPLSKEL